jgi:protocatechuate 3,4-dioxygenase beta subunit
LINLSHHNGRRSAYLKSRFVATFLCACALVSVATKTRAQGIGTSAGGSSSATASSASSGASAPRSRGSITVRVLDEANQPVRNATVTAFPLGRAGALSRPNYDNTASPSGKYVVANLEPGLYSVSVNLPGYVQELTPAPLDSDTPNAGAPPSLYRPGDSVTLRMVKGGVITGRVTDADGNPVVGARVSASRVRDAAGRPSPSAYAARERRTDDRGVFRLYGLSPGSYVVFAGGRPQFNFGNRGTPYDADAPTYYPSSARDGALEVQVQAAQEMTDIDIRYRGDKGHTVSGTIIGAPAAPLNTTQPGGANVTFVRLAHTTADAPEAQTFVAPDSQTRAFSLDAIADGDYELTASTSAGNDNSLYAAPLRVSVRGADVTGLRLTLAPLASVSGRVAFEPLKAADAARPECQSPRAFTPQELIVFSRREESAGQPGAFGGSQAAPDDKGEFTLRNLRDGRHRLGVRLADDAYFLRALTLPANLSVNTSAGATVNAPAGSPAASARGASANAPADLARNPFTLRPGDRLSGALVTVAAGAASLRGRIAVAEGEQLPGGLRAYLVPSERERAEDVLRYGESVVQTDGSFVFRNLAPGNYLLLARPAPETDQRQPRPPLALDPAARAALRRDAEAAKNPVTLQPCQRTDDFTFHLPRQ